MERPRVLLIGGLDPSGGAGLDADREAARTVGVEPVPVPTAHTDQDEHEVRAVGAVAVERWLAEAHEGSPGCVAVKFGLLPGAEHLAAAAELIGDLRAGVPRLPAVVDPVIAASSGRVFLDGAALVVLRGELLPAGPVLTPNLPEAAVLANLDEESLQASASQRIRAAGRLIELGAAAVVLKGGHGHDSTVRDLVLEPGRDPLWLERPRLPGRLRGTGCRFATALTGLLALGRSLGQAATEAGQLVARRIAEAGGR